MRGGSTPPPSSHGTGMHGVQVKLDMSVEHQWSGERGSGDAERFQSSPLPYTVPNAQKINSLARTKYRASRRQPDFPGCDFLPCPKPGLGREAHIIYFTLFRGSFGELWPFFGWAEWPRDYPSSVIRLLQRVPCPEATATQRLVPKYFLTSTSSPLRCDK